MGFSVGSAVCAQYWGNPPRPGAKPARRGGGIPAFSAGGPLSAGDACLYGHRLVRIEADDRIGPVFRGAPGAPAHRLEEFGGELAERLVGGG